MVQNVITLETHFKDNWTLTPIQYEGDNFKAPVGPWISLVFVPVDREIYAYDGADGRAKDLMLMRVYSYDKTPTKAMALSDEVKAFIECYEYDSARVGLGLPDVTGNSGVMSLENNIFESAIMFQVTNYN